jgi:hypothetical protein
MTNASLLPVEARKPSNALHRIRTDTAAGNAGRLFSAFARSPGSGSSALGRAFGSSFGCALGRDRLVLPTAEPRSRPRLARPLAAAGFAPRYGALVRVAEEEVVSWMPMSS